MTRSNPSRLGRSPLRATLALTMLAAALAACGDRREPGASQTAARVNKDEITVHEINFVLQQQRNLKPDQAEAAGRQVLERLIDQRLAVQKADELKLDRDPRVVQQLEAARKEVLARAYADKLGEGAQRPTPEEIKKYYDEKPALFSQRRIYNLQELAIEAKPEQVPALREKLAAAKNINEFVEYLRANEFRFGGSQAVRAAEQLPLTSLDAIAAMKDGQAMLVPSATGVQVVVLAGSRSQPVTEEQARPAIEQFILNDRKRKLVEEDVKAMRAAARIEYIGKFAEKAPGAPGSAGAASAAAGSGLPAPSAATPAPVAASGTGLSAGDISKGMGLK